MLKHQIISGWKFRVVGLCMTASLLLLALKKFRNPIKAFKQARKLYNRRLEYKTFHKKIVNADNRYFMSLNTPGWPSQAFTRYLHHLFNFYTPQPETRFFTLIFAITNKCGFQCEHCVEWERLNRKDELSKEEILRIIQGFHKLGISQVQLSGGEPLNRLKDILFLLDNVPTGIDFWIYSNGYSLTYEKASQLKAHGLTGVIISLDHFIPEKHDQFRGITGSYARALDAASNVVENGLALAFSCCATNDFISLQNLLNYAKVCKDAGASFIQLTEPEPVGRYWQKNVGLTTENKQLLESIFFRMNFSPAYSDYPIISYPSMVKRNNGCPAAGIHFLYVDADGDVHTCPFSKKKIFAAMDPDLEKNVRMMRERGCSMIQYENQSYQLKKGVTGIVQILKEEKSA